MNALDVLRETAKMVGGTLINADRGVYGGVGAIAAGGRVVSRAFAYLPEPDDLVNDDLVHVSWLDAWEQKTGDAGDFTQHEYRVRMQLMVRDDRGDLPHAIALLTPFLPAYFERFTQVAGATILNGKAPGGVRFQRSDPLFTDAIYPGRTALDFALIAREEEAVAYA